jgi:hypothetical protein
MMTRRTLLASLAGAAVLGASGIARAADVAKAAKKANAAAGKVVKVDTASRTFVVGNKKKGEVTVSWSDKTVFKKGPAAEGGQPTEGAAADVKVGERVMVQGAIGEGNKVVATQVLVGGVRRKKKLQ